MHALTDDDWLKGVPQEYTPNMGGTFLPKRRRFLVVHYTAGISAKGTIAHFKKPGAAASAHLVIERDGTITQLVPFSKAAWHAGTSAWKPSKGGPTVRGLNAHSLGVELVNAGWLRRTEGGNFFTWSGTQVSDSDDVVEVDPSAPESFGRRWWMKYPETQLASFIDVAEFLVASYGLEELLGHSDVAPGRKTDPGPAFPLNSIRSLLFGRA